MAQAAVFGAEAFLVPGRFEFHVEAVDAAGDLRALEALSGDPEGVDHVGGGEREETGRLPGTAKVGTRKATIAVIRTAAAISSASASERLEGTRPSRAR